jgi:site-specific DNA-adenine methylase
MTLKKYGIPYMGSKGSILKELCKQFPKAENFYDLFGGGFSVSHFIAENRSKSFKHVHYNEIRPGLPQLIQDAIAGKYNYKVYKPEFVDRETFFKKLDTDPMIKLCWSFGNNGKDYLFSKEIEPYKKSMHNAVVFNELDDLAKKTLGIEKFADGYGVKQRRLFLRNKIEYYRKTNTLPECLWPFLDEKKRAVLQRNKESCKQLQQLQRLERLQQLDQLRRLEQLERLQQLQQLERLEQLQRLQQLGRLERKISFTNKDYREVEIKPNSIIYCDPPYIGTAEYDGGFNHKEFYDWAASQDCPVYISEYTLDDDRFKCIYRINKRSLLSSNKKLNIKVEKLFANKAGVEAYNSTLKNQGVTSV